MRDRGTISPAAAIRRSCAKRFGVRRLAAALNTQGPRDFLNTQLCRPVCLAITLGVMVPLLAAAGFPSPEADERFAQAGAAYDEGRYPDAIAAYESLLDEGTVSAALLYNLGNAWYRAGDTGQAVLHYRRAGRLAPRDGDIRANLNYVLGQVDAVSPPASPVRGTLLLVGRAEWAVLAMAVYWALAILVCISFFNAHIRSTMHRAAVPGLLALLLACLGLWAWSREQAGREQVVLAADQKTRYAPLEDAQPHFDVPPGSIVTYRETEGDWIKIAVGDKTGWLKSTVCTGVDDVPYL